MSVVIVDYGSGNLRSAAKAFERQAATLDRAPAISVSGQPEDVVAAERLVLPGVGAFGDCREGLRAVAGLWEAVAEFVEQKGRPFLGICVGMQLMFERGLEHGTHTGLGWLPGEVAAMAPNDPALKIPHMGWSPLVLTDSGRAHPMLSGWNEADYVYFVHSYAAKPEQDTSTLARVEYGGLATAIVGKGNFIGSQFHPEKSQRAGLSLISAFLEWRP